MFRVASVLLTVARPKHTLKQKDIFLKHQCANSLQILCLHQVLLKG